MKVQFFGGKATDVHATRIEPFFVDSSGPHFADPTIADIYQEQLKTHLYQVGSLSDKAFLLTDGNGNTVIAVNDDIRNPFDPDIIRQALQIADTYGYPSVVMPIFRSTIPDQEESEADITQCELAEIQKFIPRHPTLFYIVNIMLQPGKNYRAYHILVANNIPTLGNANLLGQFVRMVV